MLVSQTLLLTVAGSQGFWPLRCYFGYSSGSLAQEHAASIIAAAAVGFVLIQRSEGGVLAGAEARPAS